MEVSFSDELNKKLQPQLWTRRLLWGGLPLSFVLYIFIAYLMTGKSANSVPPPNFIVILSILGPIGIVLFILSLLAKAYLLSGRGVANYLSGRGTISFFLKHSTYKPAINIGQFIGVERKLYLFANLTLPLQLMVWALIENIAVFGLVLSLLAHNPLYVYPFVGVALVGMVIHFPMLDKSLREGLYFYQTGDSK